jgi:hypothetical protein
MVAPCVTALRHLSTSIINILGSDQGTKHTPADLSTDIELLTASLAEHEVYQIKGRVFAEGDGSPTLDVITEGIQHITDSTSNPLTEYNAVFLKLQARRHLRPLVSAWSDVPDSTPADDAIPPPLPLQPEPISAPSISSLIDVEMRDLDDVASENGREGSVDFGADLDAEFLRTTQMTKSPSILPSSDTSVSALSISSPVRATQTRRSGRACTGMHRIISFWWTPPTVRRW